MKAAGRRAPRMEVRKRGVRRREGGREGGRAKRWRAGTQRAVPMNV
jgi:hypothetical protein